jgi:O-methyltransferase
MSNSTLAIAKQVLSERQRAFLRPAYYRILGWKNALLQPAITPLPKRVFTSPSLRFRLEFFQAAQIFLRVNRINGSYLEFGCHEANTFRMALNTLGQHSGPNRISNFWAFDSFEGMPEPQGIDKQKIWRAAMNTTGEELFKKITRKDSYRIKSVKGFYEHSLPGFVLPHDQYPALAYLDCDYYSSTREVLDWLGPHLRHGCILAFDDWDCYFADGERGQRKAFTEFRQAQQGRLEFVDFMKINSGGMAFICIESAKVGTDFPGY